MNTWQTVLFAYGLFNVTLGVFLLARYFIERRRDRRAEETFDRVFAERAGIDLSTTIEPRVLGGRR